MVNAVISEFNPFHNGHKYLLEQAAKKTGAEFTVCFMSGDFVQRGDIAYANKHLRAAVACKNGADIVFALPTAYAVSSASHFARAGVFMANSLGVDTTLCFGSESESIDPLFALAKIDRNALADEFKNQIKTGKSFGDALTASYSVLGADATPLKTPNNLLAFEYIKEALAQNGNIKISNVKRAAIDHDSEIANGEFASASYIRKNGGQNCGGFMPEIIDDQIDRKTFDTILMYAIMSKTADELSAFADMSEGIENRFFEAAKVAKTPDELFELVKSKRYTHAKIRRAAMSVLLQAPKGLCATPVPYLKVLAFNDKGRQLLKTLEKTCSLPVVTKASDGKNISQKHFELECRASDIYSFCMKQKRDGGSEYTHSPVYVK